MLARASPTKRGGSSEKLGGLKSTCCCNNATNCMRWDVDRELLKKGNIAKKTAQKLYETCLRGYDHRFPGCWTSFDSSTQLRLLTALVKPCLTVF